MYRTTARRFAVKQRGVVVGQRGGRFSPQAAAAALRATLTARGCREGFTQFLQFQAAATALGAAASTVATTTLLSRFFASSAALGWLLKDMVPNAAAVLIANSLATVDDDPGRSAVAAHAASNAVIATEVAVAALVPSSSIAAAAAVTSLVRSAAMIRLSASRSSMLQQFAAENNVGELQEKLQSAALLSYTGGACVGAMIVTLAPLPLHGPIVCVLTAASTFCAWMSTTYFVNRVLSHRELPTFVARHLAGEPVLPPEAYAKHQHGAKAGGAVVDICPSVGDGDASVVEGAGDDVNVLLCRPVSPNGAWRVHAFSGASNAEITAAVVAAFRNASLSPPDVAATDDVSVTPSAEDRSAAAALVDELQAHGWNTAIPIKAAWRLER